MMPDRAAGSIMLALARSRLASMKIHANLMVVAIDCRKWRLEQMSWKPQVIVSSHGDWESNHLRFETEQGAFAYVRDLSMRWFAVRHIRVVESDDPVSHRYVNGKLKAVQS
jgi:hypothetical protein